ncbi:MAG: Co2+/Mg2+ efflux protein ApaG [Actinobacteria bacterium]|nr:MAG: Co2+/Mg2+ efflux protein ApaG [Actinomycetota bacterium]
MTKSEAVTRGIRVEVESTYVPEQSDPAAEEWFFAYRIKITNEGSETAQLVSRHWTITDANGRTEEVKGTGVVGKQPLLGPGEAFEYESFCPLRTSFGTMQGTYHMAPQGSDEFDAEISPFALGMPNSIN